MIALYLLRITIPNPICVWCPRNRTLYTYEEFRNIYIKKYGYNKFCELKTDNICINGKAIQITIKENNTKCL